MCRRASGVGGELHQAAPAPAGLVDGPGEHRRADAPPAQVGAYPHRLDLQPRRPAAGQAGDLGQLSRADDVGAVRDGEQQLGGVGVDGGEGPVVGRE
jgi:hypothetical protein